jgi:DNA-binding MarR family transcriptional regulator
MKVRDVAQKTGQSNEIVLRKLVEMEKKGLVVRIKDEISGSYTWVVAGALNSENLNLPEAY